MHSIEVSGAGTQRFLYLRAAGKKRNRRPQYKDIGLTRISVFPVVCRKTNSFSTSHYLPHKQRKLLKVLPKTGDMIRNCFKRRAWFYCHSYHR